MIDFALFFNLACEWLKDMSLYVWAITVLGVLTFFACRLSLKYTENSMIARWSQHIHSGYGNVIFLMAGILWASSVSVFGSDIKGQLFEDKDISWETFFFFITVLIAIFVGVLHYIGQQRKDRASQSRPPVKAIQVASKSIIELKKALSACMFDWVTIENKQKSNSIHIDELNNFWETLASAKRMCLNSLLNVTAVWDDGNNENIVYRSNLFNIIPSKSLMNELKNSDSIGPMPKNRRNTFDIASVERSPFFMFNDNWQAKLERCDYVLVSEQNLSVSLNEPVEISPVGGDNGIAEAPPICMPFCDETISALVKQPNMHGAPTARRLKRPVYISDISKQLETTLAELSKSPKYTKHLSDRFREDLRTYYDADPTRSILSIPISMYDIDALLSRENASEPMPKDPIVVCVTNIYANKANIFVNDDMANSYCDLVKPVCYVLSILVSLTVKLVELQAEQEELSYSQVVNRQDDTEEKNCG